MSRILFLVGFFGIAGCEQRSFNRLELPHAQGQALIELRFLDATHLFARNNAEARVWNVATGAVERRVSIGQRSAGAAAASFAVSQDGAIVAAHDGKSLRVFETEAAHEERATFATAGPAAVLFVAPDETVVTLAVEAGWNPKSSVLQVWRPGSAQPAWERGIGQPRPFRAFDRAGTRIALSDAKAVTVLELSTGREVWSRPVSAQGDLTFSEDGSQLAVREGPRFVILEASSGAPVGILEPRRGRLLAFPNDLFFLDADGWVHRFAPSGTPVWSIPLRDSGGTHRNALGSAVSPRGSKLVLLVENVATLNLHDGTSGRFERRLARDGDYRQRATVNQIAISPDDSLVAVAQDSNLVVWRADGSRRFTALADPDLAQRPR